MVPDDLILLNRIVNQVERILGEFFRNSLGIVSQPADLPPLRDRSVSRTSSVVKAAFNQPTGSVESSAEGSPIGRDWVGRAL